MAQILKKMRITCEEPIKVDRKNGKKIKMACEVDFSVATAVVLPEHFYVVSKDTLKRRLEAIVEETQEITMEEIVELLSIPDCEVDTRSVIFDEVDILDKDPIDETDFILNVANYIGRSDFEKMAPNEVKAIFD